MRACTLLFFCSSSCFWLHASSAPHPGKTSLVKTKFFPSADQVTPPASVERLVICFALEPSASTVQIWFEPDRSEIHARRFESGDHRARSAFSDAMLIRVGVPPASGTTQIDFGRLLPATSMLMTAKATSLPSPEIWGSLMRFS